MTVVSTAATDRARTTMHRIAACRSARHPPHGRLDLVATEEALWRSKRPSQARSRRREGHLLALESLHVETALKGLQVETARGTGLHVAVWRREVPVAVCVLAGGGNVCGVENVGVYEIDLFTVMSDVAQGDRE
jgi:hypothetical protein